MLRPQNRAHARYQARLDAETYAKLDDLTRTCHRTRSAILRYVMQWGLTQTDGWSIDRSIPAIVRMVAMLVEPELLQQVQEAAGAHSATVAAWLRQAMRQVTINDFPASWHAIGVRFHDSQTYGQRFMLRLDETTAQKLQDLVAAFGVSRAEMIRQLIAQAPLGEFPENSHLAAQERHPCQPRS